MTFADIVGKVNSFAWGPIMLILLVGTGVYLSIRSGFIQFTKIGYWMKNTFGKIFKKQKAGEGEVTPLQAVTTALAATVGTGNIAGVTGAIVAGGPGAVFWMWISALFGMVTKYSEVVLAVRYRERHEAGDWVGGPMYYIKNGLGKGFGWLSVLFCIFGFLAAFGIGNATQVQSIGESIGSAINALGGNVQGTMLSFAGNEFTLCNLIVGIIVAVIVALVLFGGIKRIGSVTERIVPVMAVVYIIASLIVIFANIGHIGQVFGAIFKYAFTPNAVIGGAAGAALKMCITWGVKRGVFSNEAGLGSAPIAHAASSESNPVKQGLYGIFEVFMDTIVICTLTALVVLLGYCSNAISPEWGGSGGAALVSSSFAGVMGGKLGSLIVAVGISLFALSTILSWSLYGTRCFEYLFGVKSSLIYKIIFVIAVVVGATLELSLVWDIADTLNGLMAIPNLIAVLGLSGVVIKLTKEHFAQKELK